MDVAATNLIDESGSPLPIEHAAGTIKIKRLPGAIGFPSASAVAPNRIRVTWEDAVDNESGFKIERSVGAGFVQFATVGANITSFEDQHLQSSVEYTYRVRAFNAAGDGPSTSSASATTPRLAMVTGHSGSDTYHVTRSGSILQIYENVDPIGSPTYSSALADLGETLTIDSLGGETICL